VGSHSIVSGTQVVLTAVPAASSSFVGWSGDIVTTTNPLTVTVTDSQIITARFDRFFTLTVAKEGTGDGTPHPDVGVHSYTYGALVMLRAVPVAGSTFVGWSGDVVATTDPLTLTMVSDMRVIASFAQSNYRIRLPFVAKHH
jgi:hypothetical protein